jgi:hypothetical protein
MRCAAGETDSGCLCVSDGTVHGFRSDWAGDYGWRELAGWRRGMAVSVCGL